MNKCHVRMFKPKFAPLVESGAKCQTVRPTPKRIPKPGDQISLRMWTGRPYRSKQRVLREATITEVSHCHITETGCAVNSYAEPCDDFARADGFRDFFELRDWFKATHGLPFEGVVIKWHNGALNDSERAQGESQRHHETLVEALEADLRFVEKLREDAINDRDDVWEFHWDKQARRIRRQIAERREASTGGNAKLIERPDGAPELEPACEAASMQRLARRSADKSGAPAAERSGRSGAGGDSKNQQH